MRRSAFGIVLAALLAFSLCFLSACGSSSSSSDNAATPTSTTPGTIQIFAANSLQKALPLVQALYTQQHPDVKFADTQFKGSGDLVSELQGGAKADLLICASESSMDTANTNGSIEANTRKDMFTNDLVIAEKTGAGYKINSLKDVESAKYAKIAIGQGAAVPAGAYANQALNTIGLYSAADGKTGSYSADFASKVVQDSSVGNVAQHVQSGDCQIGFVYTSDIYRYPGIQVAYKVPANTHKAIVYPGAVCTGSVNAQASQDFLNFCLTNAQAQKIWSEYGFAVK
jgi:molybdate transport system substrate-binding protein